MLFRSICSPLNRQLSAFLICFDFSEWIWPHMKLHWYISLHSPLRLHCYSSCACLRDAAACNVIQVWESPGAPSGDPSLQRLWPFTPSHFVLLPPDHPKGTIAPTSAVPAGDPSAETLVATAAAAAKKLSQLEALERGQGAVSPIKDFKAEEGERVPSF